MKVSCASSLAHLLVAQVSSSNSIEMLIDLSILSKPVTLCDRDHVTMLTQEGWKTQYCPDIWCMQIPRFHCNYTSW